MNLVMRVWLTLDQLRRDEQGQDLVEYALVVSLLAVGLGLFAPELRAGMDTIYSRVASKLSQAATI